MVHSFGRNNEARIARKIAVASQQQLIDECHCITISPLKTFELVIVCLQSLPFDPYATIYLPTSTTEHKPSPSTQQQLSTFALVTSCNYLFPAS